MGRHLLGVEGGDGLRLPSSELAVGVRAEVGLGEEQEGLLAQAVFAALDGGEGVAALALDLVRGRRRARGGSRRTARGPAPSRRPASRGWRRSCCGRRSRRSRRRGSRRAGEVGGGVAAGAAQPHGESGSGSGRSTSGGVLGEQAAQEGRARGHHRDLAARDHVELGAVAQGVAVDVRRRLPMARAPRRCGRCSRRRCSPQRRGGRRRGLPAVSSDSTAPTVRRSGSRYSRATRCRSAAVAPRTAREVALLGMR